MGQLYTIRAPRGAITDKVNECTNPNFEASTAGWIADYWGPGGAGTLGLVTGIFSSPAGSQTGGMTWTTSSSGPQPGAGFKYATAWPAGVQKSIRGSFASADITQQGLLRVVFTDAGGAIVGQFDTAAQQLLQGQWIEYSTTITAPAGAVNASVQFILTAAFGGMAAGRRLLLDGVIISTTPAPLPYFDGSTPPGGGYTYAWSGAQHLSPSYRQLPDPASDVRPFLVFNGYDTSRASRNTVHQFLSGAVGATLLPSSLRSGVLRLYFDDPAKAAIAEAQHAVAGTWQFADDDNPTEGMTYVVNGSVRSYQDETRLCRVVEVPYAEVTP